MAVMNRIGLGSAAFGMDYGVTNENGRVTPSVAGELFSLASNKGIRIIDTAAAYGESEAVIGERLPKDADFKIVTKIPPSLSRGEPSESIDQAFRQSLQRLQADTTYGLLVHHAADLIGPQGNEIYQALAGLKDEGLADKIGFSAYTVDEAEAVLSRFSVDIVQLPLNILDQRFLTSGMLRAMKRQGIEIHARSLFLQGILLTHPRALPAYFHPIQDHLAMLHRDLEIANLTPLEGCLLFGIQNPDVDVMILGVTCRDQLIDLCTAAAHTNGLSFDFDAYALEDENFLHPSRWPADAGRRQSESEAQNAVR